MSYLFVRYFGGTSFYYINLNTLEIYYVYNNKKAFENLVKENFLT
jgi:hypothetical protein